MDYEQKAIRQKAVRLVERMLLQEMANVSSPSDPFIVSVHSHEHNPPHFHFRVKGQTWVAHPLIEDPSIIFWSSTRNGIAKKELKSWKGIEKYYKSLMLWLPKTNWKFSMTNHKVMSALWDTFQATQANEGS